MIAFSPLAHIQTGPIAKICGLRTPEHASAALSGGAALIGLIFAPSKRQLQLEEAERLLEDLRRTHARPRVVGVFVNETAENIREIYQRFALSAVQLSGDEQPALFETLDMPLIVAVRLRDDERERGWIALARRHPERLLLLVDAHVQGSYGGAGVVADWQRAAELAREAPLLLAGGLTPENVVDAIRAVRPLGVDVSSGVETEGVKDRLKIEAFLHAVRRTMIDNR